LPYGIKYFLIAPSPCQKKACARNTSCHMASSTFSLPRALAKKACARNTSCHMA
jgi:hypothetical protein